MQQMSALWPLLAICLAALLTGCDDGVPQQAEVNSPAAEVTVRLHRQVQRSRVLLVHSYHPEYEWVSIVTRGIRQSLDARNVDLQIYHMDTKRHTDEPWKRQVGEKALKIVEEWKPDVVIAADDNAQEYFARHLVDRPSPQVVFCGVNGKHKDYGYPASNVTGILERPHFSECMKLLKQLKPEVQRVAMLSDDSLTSKAVINYIHEQDSCVEVLFVPTPSTFAQWQEAVTDLQDEVDGISVYLYHTVKHEKDGGSMSPRDVMSWTIENSRIPVVGFITAAIDDGMLCGSIESGVEQGATAGKMVSEILAGKPAGEIPIPTGTQGQSMINLKTARMLGLQIPSNILSTIDIIIEE